MAKVARQEQLIAYEEKVRWFLRRCAEIEQNIKEAYESYGDDHQGSLDWLPHQRRWRENAERELTRAAYELDLSQDEIENIWEAAKREGVR